MMLPMMGFVFGLIGLGGLAIVIASINRRFPPLRPRPVLPYVGFICLFSGLGALLFSMGLGVLGESVFRLRVELSFIGFFGGYALGGLGGAALGFKLASNPKWRN